MCRGTNKFSRELFLEFYGNAKSAKPYLKGAGTFFRKNSHKATKKNIRENPWLSVVKTQPNFAVSHFLIHLFKNLARALH